MNARIITTTEELAGLQPEWERLERQDPDITFYSTHRFVKAWWDSFSNKPGVNLHVICVYQNNELVGIAPLAVAAEEKKNRRRKVLQFAGRGDYLNFLVDRAQNPETVLKYMFKSLEANPAWDMIRLSNIPGTSLLSIYLLKSRHNEYFNYHVENPYIDLRQYRDFADFKHKSLPSAVVNFRNKLQREAGFNFEVIRNNEDNIFERISELHRLEKQYLVERMGQKHRRSLYEDPYIAGFVKNLFTDSGSAVTFVYSDAEDNLLGYRTCYLYNRVLLSWNSAYHPRYASYRIGKILQYDILEYVFGSDIADVYDWGAGRYPWKFEWTGAFNTTYMFKKHADKQGGHSDGRNKKSRAGGLRRILAKTKKRLAIAKKKFVKAKKKLRYRAIKRSAANLGGQIILSSCWGRSQLKKNLPAASPGRLDLAPQGKAVIIAPHPDDEIFGCGLLLDELKKNNWEISLLFLTRGDAYSAKSGGSGLRKEEGEKSAQRYGAHDYWMEYEDKTLEHRVTGLAADLRDKFRQLTPDLLVIPCFADYHADHRAAAAAAFRALAVAGLPPSTSVYLYSTFSPLVPAGGAALKYLAGGKNALLAYLEQYKFSAAPLTIKSWLLLRSLTAKRYLKGRKFWEPYLVFSMEELAELTTLAETWPSVYPKLVQPRYWKEFLVELQEVSSIINQKPPPSLFNRGAGGDLEGSSK